jgi:hypothetical protein
MKALWKIGPEGVAECVNMLPTSDGFVRFIEPDKNAVIVQLIQSFDEYGAARVRRVISIECMDEEMYPELREEAARIFRA